MHATQDFVIINKPAGVPVVPTVDNVLESCLACTAQVRLLHRRITHSPTYQASESLQHPQPVLFLKRVSVQAMGETSPLLSTHRLDTCTEGLVVLGRRREFVAAFNELLRLPGAVQKYYRALTKSPPPTGAHLLLRTST